MLTTTTPRRKKTSELDLFHKINFSNGLQIICIVHHMETTGATDLNIGWGLFDFIFQFNYHICSDSWPNPCENGWIQIFTTNNIKLQATCSLSFAGPTVSLQASSTALIFNEGDIIIFVQCTDAFCLIPVDDIANAVAQNFQPVFQSGLVTIINSAAGKYINNLPTSVDIPSMHLTLQLDGTFTFANSNLVMFGDGTFSPGDGTQKHPPFTPSVSPPDSVFNSPQGQLDIIYTDYMPRTAVWALNQNGDFNQTITGKDVPADSPIQLTTSDAFFLGAVPGLASFPNMNISIGTSFLNTSGVVITSSGTNIMSTVSLVFNLYNATCKHLGWELTADVGFLVVSTDAIANGDIQITSTLSGWQSDVYVDKTYVGPVSADYFDDAIQLLAAIIPPPPDITVPTPAGFTVSSPFFTTDNADYADIGSSVQYTAPVPQIQCPGGTHSCPEQNTCCQWGGTWGCCIVPNGVCCPAGCCLQGEVCEDGGCGDRKRKGEPTSPAPKFWMKI